MVHRQLCSILQAIVARDVGNRGIGPLVQPDDLACASLTFLQAPSVLILTGFPCRVSASPPGESDGPSGSLALAAAAAILGKRAAIATDDCNVKGLRAALASRGAVTANVEVHSFPPGNDPGWVQEGEHVQRLRGLARNFQHTVALERAGQAADGSYLTMRGIPMDHLVAPLDALMNMQTGDGEYRRTCCGIGDGGNEVGMGKVRELVKTHISLGATIGCITTCDTLIVAGVSNWGGWALVAAVEAAVHLGLEVVNSERKREPRIALTPTVQQEIDLAEAISAEGVGDGVTGQVLPPGSVDGMQAEVHHALLNELRATLDHFLAAHQMKDI